MKELKSRGAELVVVTNKDHRCAQPMIAHFFGDLVRETRGVTGDTDRKPNPQKTLDLLESMGVLPQEAIIVGDGMADLNLAKNAGIDFIPVGYGYTSSETLFGQCGIEASESVFQLSERLLSYFKK
jgi:phosphoglycolate phosphatase